MARQSSQTPLLTIVFYAVLLLCMAGCAVVGGLNLDAAWGPAMLTAGLMGVVVTLAAIPLALQLAARSSSSSNTETIRLVELLTGIHENSMVSDTAKRVLFRERERELLRRTIEDDIARGDYNAGLLLCDELARLFGYRQEAETFRQRILQAHKVQMESQLHNAIEQLDHLLADRNWPKAYEQVATIKRVFPDAHVVHELDSRVHRAREAYKQELRDHFLDAARREDVERAMELLRRLDKYMSREEAAELSELAGGVVARHRENLGLQFKMAVGDKSWAEALRIGDIIIEEFPNSKMADEVRSMSQVLQSRAMTAAGANGGS